MYQTYTKKILFSVFAIFLLGIGIAFNAQANLGNDPVGIVYDGLKTFFSLTDSQRGIISNIVNYSLIVILFFISKKYINIGTLIYVLPYGFFVDVGVKIYNLIFINPSFINNIVASLIGCSLLYIGTSIFIVLDIGVSPFTAIVLIIRDKIKLSYKVSKLIFDISFVVIGALLGGKIGIVTVFMTLTTGVCVQYLSKFIKESKIYNKLFEKSL